MPETPDGAPRRRRDVLAHRVRTGLYWGLLAVTMGVIAGLGAVAFLEALRLTTGVALGHLADYRIPTPTAEGGDPGSAGFSRPWAIPLVVMGGALLSATIVARFAPEARGPGTDDAIEAIHSDPRSIRARVVVVKFVASSLTIGSGGSGGREGPTAHISAGFGSLLARRLRLSDAAGRTTVALGVGSGIGAIFNAPLGGAVLAASLPYRRDFDYRLLLPGFVTAAAAYAVRGMLLGFEPMFGFVAAEYEVKTPGALLWFVVLGAAAAGAGVLYARTFHATVALVGRIPGGTVAKPAAGGLAVGLMALLMPQILGSGYGWIQLATARETLLALPLATVLVLPLAKIVATALSIGTGGSGGLFGPGVVIGAFTGAAVWRVADLWAAPGVPDGPAPFVVVAMMACLGCVTHAPLALVLMVSEMTGSFAMVPGAIIAVGIAALLVARSPVALYRAQRVDRLSTGAPR